MRGGEISWGRGLNLGIGEIPSPTDIFEKTDIGLQFKKQIFNAYRPSKIIF